MKPEAADNCMEIISNVGIPFTNERRDVEGGVEGKDGDTTYSIDNGELWCGSSGPSQMDNRI